MLSILVPAYNEANSIGHTITRLREIMDHTSSVYEIIVIDDGSGDDTAALAESMGVQVVRHPANGGYGRALKTGMRTAQYEWCAIVDADGTYPLERFPDLLRFIPSFDMVVGARTGKYYWESTGKALGRQVLGGLVAYTTGTEIPDVNSGMRIFRKEIALAHVKRISSGFSFTTTLTLAMLLEEHFVRYVPIEYHPRVGSSKVRLWSDTLRMIQILVIAILYYNPLKLFLPLSLACSALGLMVMIATLALGQRGGLLFFAGSVEVSVLIGAIGLIAEAIRLHRQFTS